MDALELLGLPGPTQTSVDLDDTVLAASRVERVLNVALSDDTKMPDDLEGGSTEHVVFVVRESLRRRNNNRVTSVRSERVKVLHVAANDCVLEDTVRSSQTVVQEYSHQRHHERPRTLTPSIPSCYAR